MKIGHWLLDANMTVKEIFECELKAKLTLAGFDLDLPTE